MEDQPSATSPLTDSTPEDLAPENWEPDNPAPEMLSAAPDQASTPEGSSSTVAPAPLAGSTPPVAHEPRTRSEADGSTENPPTQVRDTRHTAEHDSGGRDD